MTISKRIVSIFLCLVLAVTNFAVVAGAEGVVGEPPIDVTLENGINLSLIEIYGEQGYMVWCSDDVEGDVVIPASYMNIPVRKIQTGSFSENKKITSLSMPDTVWEIADGAFCQCPNMKWIDISKNIRTIGDEAFQSMWGLEEYLIGGSKTGESNPYAYTESLTQKNGVHSYFVRDDVLFLNESLYLIGNNFRNFDYIRLFSYPQGKKDTVYKIPNDVIGVSITAFFSPVYLETLVVPSSLRSFYTFGLYYYDYNSMDLLGGPVNVVFQHDAVPETIKASYYDESGVKKISYIPTYISGGFVTDAWDGSQLIFKNNTVSDAFAEENIAEENRDGDGGSELPSFVVAPKATETLTLDTVVDEIDLDDTVTIFATQSPLDTTDDLEFSTADETIASFDGFSRGYLSGVSVGTTTYYVKSGDKMVQHDVTVTCDHIDRNGNSTLESDVNEPDCDTTYTCSVCGENVADIYFCEHLAEDGTSTFEYTSEIDATCTEEGYKLYKCSLCGEEEKRDVVSATGHSYESVVTEPTCAEEGYTTHTCTLCGGSYIDKYTEVTDNHNYSTEWTIDVEPTCAKEGSKSYHCLVCGKRTDITTIPTTDNHNYSTEWTIDQEPTCTKEGSKSRHCLICGNKTDITTIVANGHTYGEWVEVIPADCLSEGMEEHYCLDCGKGYETRTTPIGDCIFSEWYEITPASCTEDGEEEGCCDICGEMKTRVIEASGHDYVTETESSHPHTTTYNCSICGDFKEETPFISDCVECEFVKNSEIDYDNHVIFTSIQNAADGNIFSAIFDKIVSVIASYIFGEIEYFGTGTIVEVEAEDGATEEYVLIVEGDLNRDSVCDVLDAAVAQLYSAGFYEPTENEIYAANGCVAEEIDATSYQNVVNVCLAS